MTQKTKVKKVLSSGAKGIKEVSHLTGIVEPNIRRILGMGAKDGEFIRLEKGIYALAINDKNYAYIECNAAQEALPRMEEEGRKFDMIFLDPAYYSKNLIGGNRKPIKYDFIMPGEFETVINSAVRMLRTDESHLYLMLSRTNGSYKDMVKYVNPVMLSGLRLVGEGEYHKLNNDRSPVTNIRGNQAMPERILLFSRSGQVRKGDIPIEWKFQFIRPHISKSYPTEKAAGFIEHIILQSTLEGEEVLDCFAGSGVTGEQCLKLGRSITLVEKSLEAIENTIVPKIEAMAAYIKSLVRPTPSHQLNLF